MSNRLSGAPILFRRFPPPVSAVRVWLSNGQAVSIFRAASARPSGTEIDLVFLACALVLADKFETHNRGVTNHANRGVIIGTLQLLWSR